MASDKEAVSEGLGTLSGVTIGCRGVPAFDMPGIQVMIVSNRRTKWTRVPDAIPLWLIFTPPPRACSLLELTQVLPK
jgi:hypothetical protein